MSFEFDLSKFTGLVEKVSDGFSFTEDIFKVLEGKKPTTFEEVEAAIVGVAGTIVSELDDGFQFHDLLAMQNSLMEGIMTVTAVMELPDYAETDLVLADPKWDGTPVPLTKRSVALMGWRHVLSSWDPRIPTIKLPFPDMFDGGVEKKITGVVQDLMMDGLYAAGPAVLQGVYKLSKGDFKFGKPQAAA